MIRLKTGEILRITKRSHVHGDIMEYIGKATSQIKGGEQFIKRNMNLMILLVLIGVLKLPMKMRYIGKGERGEQVNPEWFVIENLYHPTS